MYQLLNVEKIGYSAIKRRSDGAIIPENPTYAAWQDYQDWLKEGNSPEPVDVEPPEPNWQDFNEAMLVDSYWQNYQCPSDLRTAILLASLDRKAEDLQYRYNLAKQISPPSNEAIASWNHLKIQFNIPVEF